MRALVLSSTSIALVFACNSSPSAPDNPPPLSAPDFGPTVVQADPPPPISGGTLLVSSDGNTVIAADADRDFVSFVDVSSQTVRVQTALNPHDRPTRLAEDMHRRVHVVLRGTGELATFSLDSGALMSRRFACAEPRGVAHDPTRDTVLVTCATGELVTFPAAGGAALSTVMVEPDLRDVEVFGDLAIFTTFRQANILQWSILQNKILNRRTALESNAKKAALAWRMKKVRSTAASLPNDAGRPLDPRSDFVVSYQLDAVALGTIITGYYAGGPQAAAEVLSAETLADVIPDAGPYYGGGSSLVLPTDIVLTTSAALGMIGAGNVPTTAMSKYAEQAFTWSRAGTYESEHGSWPDAPQIVSIEVTPNDVIVLQSREPAELIFGFTAAQNGHNWSTLSLSNVSRKDTGHDIFHYDVGTGVACASCHGEGGDDGKVWNIDGNKPRRTASLKGTIAGTAPYHWDGELADLAALAHDVYTVRMGSSTLKPDQLHALKGWVEAIAAPRSSPVDESARVRGKALFEGPADCVRCHSGPLYTNNQTMDVGTGKAFQVPPLVGVSARLPLMHDGCAETVEARFDHCDSPRHGKAATLTADQRADLVVYLKSL